MILPDFDGDIAPYDVPRGTCPSCGSAEVTHLIIGMPMGPPEDLGDPPWVSWVGCLHPGYNRRCSACDHTWDALPDPGDPAAG